MRSTKMIIMMIILPALALAFMQGEASDCPNGNDEPVYPTCDFRLALQNSSSQFDLTPYGFNNDAWVVGGGWVLAGPLDECDVVVDPDECARIFLNRTESEVRERLQRYINNRDREFLATTRNLLILDMEPDGIHPRHLSNFEGVYYPDDPNMDVRDRGIHAFAMRIRVARELMPQAKLSMWAIANFSSDGNNRQVDDRRLATYLHAGELGMYDDLDFISPALYIRYGPSDFPTREEFLQTIRNYTNNTIERSSQLRRSDGSVPLMAPGLSNEVAGGGMSHHIGEIVDVEAAQTQLRALKDHPSLGMVVYWSDLDRPTYPQIPSFFQNVKPVPSYCFCSQSPAARDDETRFLACMDPKNKSHRENPPICFYLAEAGRVKLTVYSKNGREIRKLVDGDRPIGVETIEWDRRNDVGDVVASGIYVVVLEAGEKKLKTKVAVIK